MVGKFYISNIQNPQYFDIVCN